MNLPAGRSLAVFEDALHVDRPHPCPYLPGRIATHEYFSAERLDPDAYRRLMDLRFRRSGQVIYRPACQGCRECVPIRVPVAGFRPSRSQRRIIRRNADLAIAIGPPSPDAEKWRIFREYLHYQHDDAKQSSREEFEAFLYRSPTETLEMTYRHGERLVAAGIVDLCPQAMSSVYFYFDPAESRRSLGTFGGLTEIEECRRRGLEHWYIGYYVRDCRGMNYKAAFRPYELLGADGRWEPA